MIERQIHILKVRGSNPVATTINLQEVYMPNRDGTGPNGNGPRTGGQRGDCPGAQPRQRPNDGRGRGRGGNRNRGR